MGAVIHTLQNQKTENTQAYQLTVLNERNPDAVIEKYKEVYRKNRRGYKPLVFFCILRKHSRLQCKYI